MLVSAQVVLAGDVCCWKVSCIELCLPERNVGILPTCISESDLIWRYHLYRGNQGKIRSLGWTLIQKTLVSFKKRIFGHRHIERKPRGKEGRDQCDASTPPGCPRSPANQQRRGERWEQILPHSPPQELILQTPRLGRLASRTVKQYIPVVKPPSPWYCARAAPAGYSRGD